MNSLDEDNIRVSRIHSDVTRFIAADTEEHDATFSPHRLQEPDHEAIAQRVNRKLDVALLPFLSLIYLCT